MESLALSFSFLLFCLFPNGPFQENGLFDDIVESIRASEVSEQNSEIKERFSEIELELVLHDAQVVAAGDRLQPRQAK